MQEEHFGQLTGEMAKELIKKLGGNESQRQTILKEVKNVMAKAQDENIILSLSDDEVLLLTAYREWKVKNTSGSNVFHWRKP